MTSLRLATIIILITTVVFLITWDIYVIYFAKDETATISRVVLDAWTAEPVFFIPFFILLGHLFWPQIKTKNKDNKDEK